MSLSARFDALAKRLIANRVTYALWRVDPTGIVESFLFSWRLDLLHRYRAIRREVFGDGPREGLKILDVGGGSGKVTEFISPKRNRIFVMDLRRDAFGSLGPGVHGVIGDMAHLPFRSGAVDCIVSADAVEHVPESIRVDCFREMNRVADGPVIVHCPVHQPDELFVAGELDPRFNDAHNRLFGCDEPNVREHIDSGWPTLDQFREAMPNARVLGTQNGTIWHYCLLFGRIPLMNLFVGPVYWLVLRWWIRKPPFYTALVVNRPRTG